MSARGGASRFLSELRRRKVFQVGSVYLVTAWGAALGVSELAPVFDVPNWGVRGFIAAAALGFPIALVLAWLYEAKLEVTRDVGDVATGSAVGRSATTQLAGGGTRLRVTWDTEEGPRTFEFSNSFMFGRDPECEISLDDPMVSRHHARVFVENRQWYVEDLRSRNGTRLSGQLITRAQLPPVAELKFYPKGPTFKVVVVDEAPTTLATQIGPSPPGT